MLLRVLAVMSGLLLLLTACGGGGSGTSNPEPTLTVSSASITEGNSGTTTLIFPVTLSTSSTSVVTVDYSTVHVSTDNTDFTVLTSQTLTINPGMTTAAISVSINGDTVVEPDETFTVSLTNPSGATLATSSVTGTIINDDSPPLPSLSIANASVAEGDTGTTNLVFTVTLSSAAGSDVTVDYISSNGSATIADNDYTAVNSTLTFTPGQTSRDISISVNGDTVFEPDETLTVTLSNPSANAVIGTSTGTGIIQNDDLAGVNISNATITEGNSGTSNLVFTISLDESVTGDVNVNYATGNGTATAGVDYLANSGIATITEGNVSTTVSVTVNGDADIEQNENFPIILSNVTGNATLGRSVAFGIIENDDGGMSVTLPKTGQQACFDENGAAATCAATGQDGEYQYGATPPAPRFVVNGDGTITDDLTGLIWPVDGNIMPSRDPGFDKEGTNADGVVTWQTALDYIDKLNQESYLGFNDWRLPNRNELRSLANYGVTNGGTDLVTYGFSNYARSYWSSSSYFSADAISASAWAVNMVSGYVFANDKADLVVALLYALPVRGGLNSANAPVPATGQTQCFDTSGTSVNCSGTGQDGEYQVGTPWPQTRFTVNVDTSITDQLTGLIWAPNANLLASRDPGFDTDGTVGDGKVSWQTALDYVAKLNTDNYLGHNDWYLPNINEYMSLINIQNQMTNYLMSTGWLYDAGFSNIGDIYWTSTSNFAIPATAWTAHIGSSVTVVPYAGATPASDKTSFQRYLWPVRR